MKHTVTVSLKNPRHQHPVPALFDNGKEVVYLTQFGELKSITPQEYYKIATDVDKNRFTSLGIKGYEFKSQINNLQEGMREQDLRLTHIGLTFTSDDDDKSQEGDISFWKKHPLAEVDGKKVDPKKPTKYIVVDSLKLKQKKQTDFNTVLRILNYVTGMEERELRNALTYLGGNPTDKSKEDIIIELADTNNGIVFKDSNLEVFDRVFVENKEPNKNLLLTIAKAKIYGLLSLRGADDAKSYTYKEAFCGVTDKDVEVYFTRNKLVLESLTSEIERIEGTNYVSSKQDLIPKNADVTEINKKTVLAEKLVLKVREGKITLPEGTIIPTLSVEELEGYLELEAQDGVLNGEQSNALSEVNRSVIGYEPQKDSENVVQYKGRISKQLGELVLKGGIILPIGTKRNTFKIEEIETLLNEYFKKLVA